MSKKPKIPKLDSHCLVSVIVPVYNAGDYLTECLDSILSQVYNNIEVILVDDKSTDHSGRIAESYAKKDKRVRLISKKVNQGINPARQTGFNNSTGDYIMFVDDDDVISSNLISDHLEALLHSGADVSISKAFWWDSNVGIDMVSINEDGSGETVVLNKKMAYRSLVTETSPFANSEVGILWNKIHKRSFFEDYDWSLSNMPSEDFMTNAYLFDGIESMVYIDRVHYFHRTNINSTMDQLKHKKGANTKQSIDIFDALFRVAEVFKETSKRNGWNFDNEIIYFKYRYFFIRIQAFVMGAKFSEADFFKIKKYTSITEINILCSDDFRRYVSEYIYPPAVDILTEIAEFWGLFSESDSVVDFLEKNINQLKSSLRSNIESLNALEVTVSHQRDILNYLQSLRGATFNFLGRIKRKVLMRAAHMLKAMAEYCHALRLERKYKNCWVVMDRVESASDNGYAFYSFLLREYPEVNAYFAINEDSIDVSRLKAQGFKLVFIGSEEHSVAIDNSSKLFYAYFTFEYSNDIAQRIFLGHGVTKDSLPNPGLRSRDYFITALNKEQDFLSERVDMKAVKTGLPRYDLLIEKVKNFNGQKNKIVIAPTWRPWLYINMNKINESPYLTNWQKFLNSDELRDLSDKYDIVLILHPMMASLGEQLFSLPDYIKTRTYAELEIDGLHNLLIRTELLVTDFSSISFDAVIAGAKVVYFQFDEAEYRDKGLLKKGWFEYSRDGFGPVFYEYDKFVDYIGIYSGEVDLKYNKRSQAIRDEVISTNGSSRRIIELMINKDKSTE